MDDSAPPLRVPSARRIPLLVLAMALAVVAVFWFGGFLPWALDGFHLEAGRFPGAGDDLTRLWLPVPLIAGQLTALVAFTLVGSIAAMTLPVLVPAVPRPLAVVVAALVLLTTALVLVLVARSSIADGSGNDFAGDSRVLDGLVVGVLGLVVLGIVVGGLASLQVGFLPLAAAVVVTQLASWFALLELPRPDLVTDLVTLVLLAGAFVLSVRRAAGWAATWPVALAIVWLGVPFGAALTTIAGRLRPGQNLDESLDDVYREGWDVFGGALWEAPRTWWPELVALGIGAVWLVARRWAARPSPLT